MAECRPGLRIRLVGDRVGHAADPGPPTGPHSSAGYRLRLAALLVAEPISAIVGLTYIACGASPLGTPHLGREHLYARCDITVRIAARSSTRSSKSPSDTDSLRRSCSCETSTPTDRVRK